MNSKNYMSSMKINIHFASSTQLDYSRGDNGEFANQLLNYFDKKNFTLSNSTDADMHILINYSAREYKSFRKTGKSSDHFILLRLEPESVFPAQYSRRITKKFGLVITIGQKFTDNNKFIYLGHPYCYLENPNLQMSRGLSVQSILKSGQFENLFQLTNWLKRPIQVSLIAGNKVSIKQNGNYRLRRKLAKSFKPELLEIYGDLWNGEYYLKLRHRIGVLNHGIRNLTWPSIKNIYGDFFAKYPNYKGKIKNKHEIVRRSKFSLVIENSSNYVSEKIFDAMINGSIPIYFGPNLEQFNIPAKDLVLLENCSVNDIENRISKVKENEIERYLNNIRNYLNSSQFQNNWTEEIIYNKIVDHVLTQYQKIFNY